MQGSQLKVRVHLYLFLLLNFSNIIFLIIDGQQALPIQKIKEEEIMQISCNMSVKVEKIERVERFEIKHDFINKFQDLLMSSVEAPTFLYGAGLGEISIYLESNAVIKIWLTSDKKVVLIDRIPVVLNITNEKLVEILYLYKK